MPINEKIAQHIKENLNSGLHLKSENAKLIDTPILVIGLGGTGADALIRIKNLVNERLNSSSINEKPDNIEYLAIDTDPKTRSVQYNGTKFSEANSETCIMEDAKLSATYKNLDSNQMPQVSEWISKDIDVSQVKDGAGGFRQVGRFLFFKEFKMVKEALERKIINITRGRTNNKKVYVFIVTGVSGGTGSGTFIDMPYVVNKLLSERGYVSQILGFIFLPDINIQVLPLNAHATQRNMQRNGFAALKELDYLMNFGKLSGNSEKFEQDYGNGFKVFSEQPPYDICHLVSSINSDGVNNYTKESCMAVTSETIINFIADERNISNEQFAIAQYISNISQETNGFISSLKTTKLPVNYKYNVIGSTSGVLPMDDVLNYLTHLLFKEMKQIYDNKPTPEEVIKMVEQLRINQQSIESVVSNGITLRDIDIYNYDSIKSDNNLVEKVLNDSIQNTLLEIMDKNVMAFIKDFRVISENRINDIFIDFEKGPFFASRLLNSENVCILKHIKEIVNKKIPLAKTNQVEIKRLKDNVIFFKTKLVNSKPLLGFNKEGLAKNYKKACIEYYSEILRNYIFDKMTHCYDEIYNCLNDKNNEVFSVFTEMLSILKNIFTQYAGIENDTIKETEGEKTVFSWDIIDPTVLVTEVKFMINNDDDFKISFKAVAENFVKDLIENYPEWINESNPNVASKLNDFIVNKFSTIARESIGFYIKRISKDNTDKENTYINKVMQKLTDASNVMFPLSILGETLNNIPVYNYLSIPYDTEVFNDKLVGLGNVKKSVITNRISMLKVNLAYPLVAYRELESYEAVYKDFTGKTGVGMHLYESKDKNWADLPSPIYDGVWSNGYTNESQKAENDLLRNVFDKGLKYGYIYLDENKKDYICCYSKNGYDIEATIENCGISDLNDNISKSDCQKVISSLKRLINEKETVLEQKKLYDYKLDINNKIDIEYSKGIFINMPSLNKSISVMVNNHEFILNTINNLEEKFQSFSIYTEFAASLYTKLIKKERASYKYENSKQLLVTLYQVDLSMADTYYEYYLFNAFKELKKEERKFLYEKSQKIINECDDSEIKIFMEYMNECFEVFDNTHKKLSKEYETLENGTNKVNFYAEIRDEVSKAISLYS